MTSTDSDNPQVSQSTDPQAEDSSRMSVSRIIMIVSAVLIGIILLIMGFALVVSVTAAETWSPVMQIFRDVFMIIFILELILIIGAIAILGLQIARFFIMLQIEIKPILDNARETTKATKATARFISKNSTEPLIKIMSFFTGLRAFIGELLRIRRLIKPNKK